MTSTASQRVREVPAKTHPAIPGAPRGSVRAEVTGLQRALRAAIEGQARFDPASLAMYANDASNFRQVPIGVVIPRTLYDVVAAHRVCHQFGAPICNRGGGTSLSGETVNNAVIRVAIPLLPALAASVAAGAWARHTVLQDRLG